MTDRNTKVLKAALISSVASMMLAGGFAAPALAQEESAALETIVVTGSRIARPELESSSPVQVLGADFLQQQSAPNVADMLAELPAIGTPTYSRANSNFLTAGNGISSINLRNLGDQRTLVLMNGRRIVAGIGGSSIVDINVIPTDLLDRVEVLTGGASAVYGSEAVAGVVNFVLKDNFTGVRLRAQGGVSDEKDNGRYLFAATVGTNLGDRGNIAIFGSYDKDEGLFSRNRKISEEDVPFRSSFVPQGRFQVPGGSIWTYDPNNNLKNSYNGAVDGFNRNGLRYIAVPLERYSTSIVGHYDILDNVTAFVEGSYVRTKSNSSLEPLATDNSDARLPDGTILAGLDISNPFIPTAIRNEMNSLGVTTLPFRKRMVGVFDRSNVNDREFYRFVVGLKGEVFDNWNWDIAYNRGRNKEETSSETGFRDRYYYALDAIAGPGGTVICRDAAARADGCAPFNPFGFGSVSAAAANYLTDGGYLSTYASTVTQSVISGNIVGSLFALPAGNVQLAAGAERRVEKSLEEYDAITQAGNTLGNALANTSGRYSVFEAYSEVRVPLVADAPFAHYLGLDAAVRYADYSSVGSVWSWKVNGEWAPTSDIRFRGGYSRAVRAPNIGELFGGQNQTFPSGLTDPCEGATATSARPQDAYCRSLPGVARQIATSGTFVYDNNADRQSIEGFDGGNPDLGEETAKSWTLGAVITPSFAPRLTMQIDFFDVKINGAIITVPRQFIIDQCVETAGASELCNFITRETANPVRPRSPGTIWQVNSGGVNAATIKTRGVDFKLGYTTPLDFISEDAKLSFTATYQYLDKLTLQPLASAPAENNRGQLSGDGRLGAGFKHRALLSTTVSNGGLSFNWRMNYQSKIKDTLDENGPLLAPEFNEIGAYTYHDIQLRYAIDAKREFDIYFGVDNLFDKKPPLIDQNGASNITGTETAADSYDPFGRAFYAGVEVKF